MRPAGPAYAYALQMESLLDSLPMTGKKYKNRFLVKQHEELIPVSLGRNRHFFTTNGLVCLVRRDGKQFMVDYTLEELEKLLDPAHFSGSTASSSPVARYYPHSHVL